MQSMDISPGFDLDGLGARILHALWFNLNLPRTTLLTIRECFFVAISYGFSRSIAGIETTVREYIARREAFRDILNSMEEK